MELYYSPEAERDLQNIRNSIIENFDSEEIAKKVLKKITGTVRGLLAFPYMGEELARMTGISTEYRCLYCERNYVFYRLEKDRVYIVRILHERQDFMRILFGITEESDTEDTA